MREPAAADSIGMRACVPRAPFVVAVLALTAYVSTATAALADGPPRPTLPGGPPTYCDDAPGCDWCAPEHLMQTRLGGFFLDKHLLYPGDEVTVTYSPVSLEAATTLKRQLVVLKPAPSTSVLPARVEIKIVSTGKPVEIDGLGVY